MTRYRKRPVEVDAARFDGAYLLNEDGTVPGWAVNAEQDDLIIITELGEGRAARIRTLEGDMTCRVGDYIVRGVEGELYPCAKSVFEATYERADRCDWNAAIVHANDVLNDLVGLEANGDVDLPESVYNAVCAAAGALGLVERRDGMPDASEQQRVLHSPFDIETHRATFVNYLEVCIDPEGTVHYAVPSHQKWLMARYMGEKGYNGEERAWEDFPVAEFSLGCLARRVGCVAVWRDGYVGEPNARQRLALRRLKEAGLYEGSLGSKEG